MTVSKTWVMIVDFRKQQGRGQGLFHINGAQGDRVSFFMFLSVFINDDSYWSIESDAAVKTAQMLQFQFPEEMLGVSVKTLTNL